MRRAEEYSPHKAWRSVGRKRDVIRRRARHHARVRPVRLEPQQLVPVPRYPVRRIEEVLDTHLIRMSAHLTRTPLVSPFGRSAAQPEIGTALRSFVRAVLLFGSRVCLEQQRPTGWSHLTKNARWCTTARKKYNDMSITCRQHRACTDTCVECASHRGCKSARQPRAAASGRRGLLHSATRAS